MFSSLFSSGNKEISKQKTVPHSGIISRMRNFAGKVSVILGLTTANSMAIPGPSVPDMFSHAQEISVPENPSSTADHRTIDIGATLPQKAPIIPKEEIGQIEPVSVQPKLRIATAQRWESVGLFMLKNFGTEEGWEFLVEKERGQRVRVATRDLIAGKTYVLARDEKEANNLANIFRKRSAKKSDTGTEIKDVALDSTENTRITTPLSYNHFAASKEAFYSIAERVWLPEWQVPKAIALFATIGHHESGTRYNIQGPKIRNKKSVHNGTYADGRYQIMEQNKRAWSREYFGKVLPFTPENQDKIAFAKFAERFASYSSAGLDLPVIVKEIAADWYGRGRAMPGQPTTSQYSDAISNLYERISYNFSPVFSVAKKYHSQEYASVTKKIPSSHEERKKTIASARTSPVKEKPKTMVSVIAANDTQFEEQKPKIVLASLHGVRLQEGSSDNNTGTETRSAPVHEIELIPVAGEVKNVVRSILEEKQRKGTIGTIQDQTLGKEYKTKLMKGIWTYANLDDSEREHLIATLSNMKQATDFIALYKRNIANFESLAQNGTEKQKREIKERGTIQKLYTLLEQVESSIMMASNDPDNSIRRAA